MNMENDLNKLDVPTFFKKKLFAIITVISTVIGIVSFLVPKCSEIKFELNLNWIIFISTIIILIFVYIFLYYLDIKRFKNLYDQQYRNIQSIITNNKALNQQFKDKQSEIENLEKKLYEYDRALQSIENSIVQGLTDITFNEKEYLKNIYEIHKINKKYLQK